MSLIQGQWLNDSFAYVGDTRCAVGYRHQVDKVWTGGADDSNVYQYVARCEKTDRIGRDSDWASDMEFHTKQSGRFVIADKSFDIGKVYDVVEVLRNSLRLYVHLSDNQPVVVKLDPPEFENRRWVPSGYADPKHLHNHPDIRKF